MSCFIGYAKWSIIEKVQEVFIVKKWTVCILSALLLAGCSNNSAAISSVANSTAAVSQGGETANSAEDINMVNPWTEVANVEEAAKEAGLQEFAVPEIPAVVDTVTQEDATISFMENIAEVSYSNDDNELVIRKGNGTEDVSGVYSDYSEQRDIDVNGMLVHVSETQGTIHIATWSDGENAYSLTYNIMYPGKGLSEEQVREIVAGMK